MAENRLRAVGAARSALTAAIALVSTGSAWAHTVSVGYEVLGNGAVNVWYGTYHDASEARYTEGSLHFVGPQFDHTVPFTSLVSVKPSGLMDGTTNFYSGLDQGLPAGLYPTYNDSIYAWQGAAFTNLVPGTYTLSYVPIQNPTAVWQPKRDITAVSLTLPGSVVTPVASTIGNGTELSFADPTSTFYGGYTVSGATAGIGVTGAGVLGTGPLTLDGGAALEFDASFPVAQPLANTIALSGIGGVIDTQGNAGSLGGVISGAGGLTVIGGGRVQLSGTNTYAGGTLITGGTTLAIGADGALGAAQGGIAFDSGILQTIAGVSSARGVTILRGNAVVDTRGNTDALGGIIAGPGALTVTGGGQLALTGANTYAGGTLITGGATLAIGTDGALGAAQGGIAFDRGTLKALGSFSSARSISVLSGGGTIDSNGYVVSLNGPILLNGPLQSIGLGRVMFAGAAQVNGTLSIANGMFSDNGIVRAQNVVVGRTGTLRGTGVIAAPTTVSGTLAPGNSPGTLTFTAPLTLAAGSVTAFDIDGTGTGTGAGNYSRVVVSGGTITLDGTLQPQLRGITGSATNTYVPPLGQVYLVQTAQGGIGGSYAGLTQPAGLATGTRFDAIYGPSSLGLVVTAASYAHVPLSGQTPDEVAAGAPLDALRPAAGVRTDPSLAALLYPLYAAPAGAILPALDQLAPTIYGDSLLATRDSWYQAADSISDQMAFRRAGAESVTTQADPHGLTLWTTGTGQFGHLSSSGAPGDSTTTGGAVVGADRVMLPGLVAGIAVGGASIGTRASNGATATGSAVQVMLYASAQRGRFFADAQGGLLHSDQDIRRTLSAWSSATRSSNGADGGGGQLHAGLHYVTHGFAIEPMVGLTAMSLSGGGVTEQSGPLAERVAGNAVTSTQSLVGVRAGRVFTIGTGRFVTAHAQIGWTHEFADVNVRETAFYGLGSGPSFSVVTAPLSRDSAKLGAVLEARVWRGVSIYGGYGASLAQHNSVQSITGGVNVTL